MAAKAHLIDITSRLLERKSNPIADPTMGSESRLDANSGACSAAIATAARLSVSGPIYQDLMLDQNAEPASPTVIAAREICLLLVNELAGAGVANLNRHVVIRLGHSRDDPEKRLRGAQSLREVGLTSVTSP